MGTMRVMGIEGDTKIVWDADKKAEVDNARRTFDDLKKKGYKAFSVKKDGGQGSIIEKFDKYAEKLIMAPQIAGG